MKTITASTTKIVALSAIAFGASSCGESNEEAKQPNVIYILADDLGYGDLSCYGQEYFTTPNIDKLAENGMRFTQFYAGCTVSAPSRCALMTGKTTGQTYVRGNKGVKAADGRSYDTPIPDEEFTLGEMFQSKGYKTACVGKWGLGGPGTVGSPMNQGFDYFFGYLGQGHAHKYFPKFLHENDVEVPLDGTVYSHDMEEEKALKFITENKDNPFFIYLTYTIPHAELALPEEYTTEFEGKFEEEHPFSPKGGSYGAQPEPRKTFAAMVKRLDTSVGTLVAHLEKLGLTDNTLIVFTSDNGAHMEGGADPKFFNSTNGLRGVKRALYEGGIRVPMIVKYPGVVPANVESAFMGGFWDFMPTFGDLIGAEYPENDQTLSILPLLKGNLSSQPEHEYLYWEFHEEGGRQAVRKGDWKLIRQQWNNPEKSYFELFNIFGDPFEERDVAKYKPEIVEELAAIMDSARTPSELFDKQDRRSF